MGASTTTHSPTTKVTTSALPPNHCPFQADFAGKTVVDVGAGSGILSLFAAQAGASRVYAVEASDMANHAAALCAANPGVGARVSVVRARVESAGLPPRCADVLVSEPMGTLLLNERMLESYVRARDTLLKPGGRMFPALGRIHVAAFSDAALHAELDAKAAFWRQPDFYGVNLGCLERPAADGFFRQVVVDAVPAGCLVSGPETKVIDFGSVTVVELQRVVVPLRLVVAAVGDVHGVAAWFDVLFDGSTSQRWLSTAPGLPTTHWCDWWWRVGVGRGWCVQEGGGVRGAFAQDGGFRPACPLPARLPSRPPPPRPHPPPHPPPQPHPTPVHTAHPTPVHIARPPRFQLRCVLQRPLRVTRPGVLLEGELVLEAHERQSYWVHLSLSAPPAAPGQAVQQVDAGT